MIAALLLRVALFLVPFIIYWLYTILQKQAENEPVQRRKPWTKLFIAGLLLLAVSFVVEGLIGGESIEGRYVEPRVENGRIIPGHIEPSQELGR